MLNLNLTNIQVHQLVTSWDRWQWNHNRTNSHALHHLAASKDHTLPDRHLPNDFNTWCLICFYTMVTVMTDDFYYHSHDQVALPEVCHNHTPFWSNQCHSLSSSGCSLFLFSQVKYRHYHYRLYKNAVSGLCLADNKWIK